MQRTACTIVAEGLAFPEGPVAMPDGSVLVVEIGGRSLTRVRTDGTLERIAALEGGPNGAALGPEGWVYVCNSGGCRDLTLRCSQDGKCLLMCHGSGCSGNVKVECGTNFCVVACSVPNDSIHQECGSSCSCMGDSCSK